MDAPSPESLVEIRRWQKPGGTGILLGRRKILDWPGEVRPGRTEVHRSVGPLEIPVITLCQDWYAAPPWVDLCRQWPGFLLMSYQGWVDGRWCDGPVAHVAGGRLVTWCGPGEAGPLVLPARGMALAPEGAPLAGEDQVRDAPGLRSLLLADRLWEGPGDPSASGPGGPDAAFAIGLTLLRMNRPEARLRLHQRWLADAPQPAGWKRLLQNLGVEQTEGDVPAGDDAGDLLRQRIPELPAAVLPAMAARINHRGDLIPPVLLKTGDA